MVRPLLVKGVGAYSRTLSTYLGKFGIFLNQTVNNRGGVEHCGNKPGQETFETIYSFGNRLGGSIFPGIEDDGAVVGIGSSDADEVKHNVINVANNPRSIPCLPRNSKTSITAGRK